MTAALPAVMPAPTPPPTAAKAGPESGGDDFEQLLAGLTPSAGGPVSAVSGKTGGDRDGAARDDQREQPGADPAAGLLAAALLGAPPSSSATAVALSTAGAGTASAAAAGAGTASAATGTAYTATAGAVSPVTGTAAAAGAGTVSSAAAGATGPGPSSSPSPTAGQAGSSPHQPSPAAPPGTPGPAGAASSAAPFGPQLDSALRPARPARSGQPATDGRPQTQLPPSVSPPTGPATAGGTAHPVPARPASVDALAAAPAAPAPDPAAAASAAGATQPVPAPATAAPPIAAPPPPAAPPVPGVGIQLAGAINRIAHSNGGHEVTLRLKPERLGSVAISVRVEDSRVQLDLRCAQPETVSAVHTALTELRAELATTGFSAVSVNVQSETATDRQAQDRTTPPGTRDIPHDRSPAAEQTARPHRPRPPAGGVDLFL